MCAAAIVLLLHVCHIEDREEDSDEYSESDHEDADCGKWKSGIEEF